MLMKVSLIFHHLWITLEDFVAEKSRRALTVIKNLIKNLWQSEKDIFFQMHF